MRIWAKEHGLESVYDEFLVECDEIAEQCEAEGYPSHGSNYELRVEQLKESYPELFGGDEDYIPVYAYETETLYDVTEGE